MNQTTVNGSTTLFCDYYKQWITVYKEGAIRPVTMNKYHMAHHWLEKLVPKLTLGDLDRFAYQKLLNDYASEHERQTTMDFHHHLKCAILDAVDEGLIQRDPTRKAIIKGKTPREKKPKYLNQYELHKLLDDLDLKSEINLDWLLLLIAKTGIPVLLSLLQNHVSTFCIFSPSNPHIKWTRTMCHDFCLCKQPSHFLLFFFY